VVGTAPAGTGEDVELNIQIVNGSTPTAINASEVVKLLRLIERYLVSNGIQNSTAGTDLPPQV